MMFSTHSSEEGEDPGPHFGNKNNICASQMFDVHYLAYIPVSPGVNVASNFLSLGESTNSLPE